MGKEQRPKPSNKDADTSAEITVTPPGLSRLISERKILPGEQQAVYDELLSQITSALQPRDIIESMYVSDIVDATFEAHRLKNMKVRIVKLEQKEAARQLLRESRPPGPDGTAEISEEWQLVEGWWSGDFNSWKVINEIAGREGENLDPFLTRAFSNKLDEVERIDRMIAAQNDKRDRGLRELERRREARVSHQRARTRDVEDVEL